MTTNQIKAAAEKYVTDNNPDIDSAEYAYYWEVKTFKAGAELMRKEIEKLKDYAHKAECKIVDMEHEIAKRDEMIRVMMDCLHEMVSECSEYPPPDWYESKAHRALGIAHKIERGEA